MSRLPFPKTSTRAVPPREESTKSSKPPGLPLLPPFAMRVALPALPRKNVSALKAPLTAPPLVVIEALPAVEPVSNAMIAPPAPLTLPPSLIKVASPAVEVLRKVNSPSLLNVALPALELPPKAIAPVFVNEVKLPAVALFVKMICPGPGVKFCTIPELLVMPLPLMVTVGAWLMNVNGLAPALNTIPFTSVSAAKNTLLLLENANVAMSAAPLGIVAGVQFAAAFQFPELGFALQVALPAKAAVAAKNRSMMTPWSTPRPDSLETGGGAVARTRAMVFITRFVRHFRFMCDESN